MTTSDHADGLARPFARITETMPWQILMCCRYTGRNCALRLDFGTTTNIPQTYPKRRGLHDDCQDVLGPTSTKHANAIRDHKRDDYDKDQTTDPRASGSSGSAVRAFVSGRRDFTVTVPTFN